MRTLLFSFVLLTIATVGFAALPAIAQEVPPFVPLSEPGDLTPELATGQWTFIQVVNAIFIAVIGLGSLLAVVMIAIGGIQYIGTDSYSSKGEAKTRIMNAVIGLVILLTSWLILNTINPDLTNLNIFGSAQTQNMRATAISADTDFACTGEGCCATLGHNLVHSEGDGEVCSLVRNR